jgi:hypothetical protein
VLIFLAYWLSAWGIDTYTVISRWGHLGGETSTTAFVLTCLVSPMFAAALVAWWRAPEGRRSWMGAMLAAVVVCEVNLVVIFCEDAGISAAVTGVSKARFDLLWAALTLAVIGAVLGLFAAAAVWLVRTLIFLHATPGEAGY